MSDLGTIEKRTIYRIPEVEDFYSPYVSGLWPSGKVTVDGDMVPVEQQAITWCTTHSSSGQGPSRMGVACHYSALRQATKRGLDILEMCEFSDGGLEHKWWRDL